MALREPAAREPAQSAPRPAIRATIYGLLAVCIFLVYLPSLGNGFVDWDDSTYVVRNTHIEKFDSATLVWAFTTFDAANWHPLTWISHALDRALFGLNPRGHHRTSIFLHAGNALLLLLLLHRLSRRFWASAAGAAIFALHPLRVESVAWIAERKDLLCALFVFLALLAYERHARRPARWSLLPVSLAFALALLCKPMAVTLPFLLLLLDVWPFERLRSPVRDRRVLLEKVPLFLLAAASSVVTYMAQVRGEAVRSWEMVGAGERLSGAVVALASYLGKTLWPAPGSLLPFYTHPHHLPESSGATLTLSAALLLGLSILVAWQGRRRPFLAVGSLAFVGMLVPVLGLVQVGAQRSADRYTYLPTLGLLLAGVWLLEEATAGRPRRQLGAALGIVLLLGTLAVLTWDQQRVWRDSVSLWEAAVAGEPASPISHLNLANAVHEAGLDEESMRHYRKAVALGPGYAPAHAALGVRLGERREFEAAIESLEAALRLRPSDAFTRGSLGNCLLELGRTEEAVDELAAAVALAPSAIVLRNSLGKGLLALGRVAEAIGVFEETLALDPDSAPAHNNLALVMLRAGRKSEGIALLREALRLDPSSRSAQYNLELALREAGDAAGAEKEMAEARRLDRRGPTGAPRP